LPTLVLKLFAGQGAGRTDKAATFCPAFGEHKNKNNNNFI